MRFLFYFCLHISFLCDYCRVPFVLSDLLYRDLFYFVTKAAGSVYVRTRYDTVYDYGVPCFPPKAGTGRGTQNDVPYATRHMLPILLKPVVIPKPSVSNYILCPTLLSKKRVVFCTNTKTK